MTVEQDYSKFKAFWDNAARVYRTGGGEAEAKFYFELLKEYPLKDVVQAVMECMKVCEFIPKPVDIIEQLNGGRFDDMARMAWVQVRDAIRKGGSTFSVTCEDPAVIWAIQALGGWRHFCFMNAETTERQFCEYYMTALRQKIQKNEVPDHLAGDRELNSSMFDVEADTKEIRTSIRFNRNTRLIA